VEREAPAEPRGGGSLLNGFVRSGDDTTRVVPPGGGWAGGRHRDETERARQRPGEGERWTHDRFAESDRRGSSWLEEGEGGREDVDFDPYAGHARTSKAYAPDDRRERPGPGRGVDGAGHPRPPSPSASATRGEPRDLLPSHDTYEWKSRAGGVAIFVRKGS
jgi:hypothetical protein